MKRKSLCIIFVLLFASAILFSACASNGPYIEVIGLKTEYYIGDELDISSIKVHYYASKKSSEFEEIELTADMITGFSTTEVGTFTMTISYNNISKSVSYSVQNKPISITETEAETILSQTTANMATLSEVKEISTTTFFGITQTTYKITTQNKQYWYQEQDSQSWIIYENDSWKRYSIEYDVFDEVVVYKEYDVQIESNNVIAFEYSNLMSDSMFGSPVFVDANLSGSKYVITYYVENLNNSYFEFNISNNELISLTLYRIDEGEQKVWSTTTYSYEQGEINSIPQIPNKDWEYGGFYIKL